MPEELRAVIAMLTRRPFALEKVLTYRNESVLRTFVRGTDLPITDAGPIFQDTLRWLWLCRVHDLDPGARRRDSDVPRDLALYSRMRVVDEMWHAFLLCSRDYASFCRAFLGTVIHHRPNVEDPEAQDFDLEEYRRTVAYVCRRLGPEVARRWFVDYPRRYPALAKGA